MNPKKGEGKTENPKPGTGDRKPGTLVGLGEKETLSRLENLGKKLVQDVRGGEEPKFQMPLRSRSNILYDEGMKFLRMGDKKEERRFVSVGQAKKFMQTIAIANKAKKFVGENLHTSIRGLYYQLKFTLGEDIDEELFSEQSESNELIEDLEVALAVKREDFNLTTDRKGVVAGPIKIKDRFAGEETVIDGTKMGRSGWMVPSDVDNGMDFVDVDADYVLVVEKDALWQRLNEDKFWKKENCIIITPKGQASRGTRRLIRKLADQGIPVYAFSIDGEEPIVVTDSDGAIRNEMIGGLVNSQMDRYGSVATPLFEKSVVGGYNAMEMEKNGAIKIGRILNALRHPSTDKLYSITTGPGYTVRTTGAHSIMVFEDYGLKPKNVAALKEGDLVVSSTAVPNNESLREIDLIRMIMREKPELGKDVYVIDGGFRKRADRPGVKAIASISDGELSSIGNPAIRYGKSEIRIKSRMELSPELARLLGYFVAEGSSYGQVQLTFGSHEKKYIEDAKRLIGKCFGVTAREQTPHPSSVQITAGGKLLALIFEQVLGCGKYAENKRIPYVIFNAPEKAKMEFLRGYFRGDGGVKMTRKGVRLWARTVSRGLASDLVLLLMQVGCWATVEKKKRGGQNELDKYDILMYNRESIKKLKGIAVDIEPGIADALGKETVKSPVFRSMPTSLLKPLQKTIYRSTKKGISDIFNQQTVSLEKLKRILPRDFSSVLKKDGVLEYLGANPGRTANGIAAALGIGYITVFKALKRAERNGLVSSRMTHGKRCWKTLRADAINPGDIEKLKTLRQLAENGVILLPVRKIERVDSSDGYAYDVEVNPTHTFFGGLGPLLLHNTDCDAWGWYIYWTIKTGSMNLAYLGRDFAIPEMRFIGVTMKDIGDFEFLQKLTINAKEVDLKRAEEMLGYPWINAHKPWVEELKRVLKTKKKLEQDALQGQRLTFVGEYIRKKINEKDFLP